MGKKNYNYLEQDSLDVVNVDGISLSKVASKIAEMLTFNKEIDVLEQTLKDKKAQRDKLSGDIIPTMMQEMGLKSTEMEDGSKIKIVEDFHCRIPKDRLLEAYDYLREHNLGDIIKNNVGMSFGKGEDTNADQLKKHIESMGFIPEVKSSVHPSTLKAVLKKRHEEGKADPIDLFQIFIRQQTKVTNNKG
jgi:hypothetical protein